MLGPGGGYPQGSVLAGRKVIPNRSQTRSVTLTGPESRGQIIPSCLALPQSSYLVDTLHTGTEP